MLEDFLPKPVCRAIRSGSKVDFFLISAVIIIMVFGQVMSKIGSAQASLFNAFVLLGYAALLLRAVIWIVVLQRLPVSFAYPLLSLTFVFVLIASRVFFGETVTLYKVIGSLLIITGVTLISAGKLSEKGE